MPQVSLRGALFCAAAATMGLSAASYAAGPVALHGPGGGVPDGSRNASYIIEDGTSEQSIGLGATSNNDIVWLNTFPTVAGAEKITSVSVAYGANGFTGVSATNGTPVTILVYNDPDGGDPANGTLLASVPSTVQNTNTNIFNTVVIPGGAVVGSNFAVGVIMRAAQGATNPFPAAEDTTAPSLAGRSWISFDGPNAVNTSNLAATPAANRGFIETFGSTLVGNWLVRADGVAVPEPASLGLLGLGTLALVRRRRA